jgi:transcriptional antiterminator NusG
MSDENATPTEPPVQETAEAAPAPAEPPAPASSLPDTAEHIPLAAHEETPAAEPAPEPEPEPAPPEPVAEEPMIEEEPVEEPAETPEETPPPVEPEEQPGPPASAAETIEPEAPAEPTKKKRTRKAAAPTPAEPAPTSEDASPEGEAEATPVADGAAPASKRNWYVIKVQSGREESIKAAVERKIKIEGLEEFFGRIEIPVEEMVEKKKVKAKVKDKKTGEIDTVYQEKNVTKKRKKYPGYLFAEVEFNDRILYVFRETPGVGDFVGASLHRAPNPMPEHEVQSMLTGVAVKGKAPAGKVKVKLDYEKGDKVKIRDGAFSGMEGEVKHISEAKDASETPKVKVEVTIFGRPVEVELDYWQVDKA